MVRANNVKTQDSLLQNQQKILSQQQEMKKQSDVVASTVSETQQEFESFIVDMLHSSHIEKRNHCHSEGSEGN